MSEDNKGKKAGYWLATSMLGVALIGAGIMDLSGSPAITETFENLGYPLYIAPLLGVAKLLAAMAILTPRFRRLKEWAYAGVAVDFIGAAYSHAATEQFMEMGMPVLLVALMFVSWYLRPASRNLPDVLRLPDPMAPKQCDPLA